MSATTQAKPSNSGTRTLAATPTRNTILDAGSSLIASVACATLRLSTPSCGYSPRCASRSACKVESRGARQVDELLEERHPIGVAGRPILVPRAQSRRGNRSALRRVSLTLVAALTVTRSPIRARVSRLLGDFIEKTFGA